ncbi:hypothetical protein QBC40DRAFT_277319 [Triangularia verruculosa]|uniref:Uncharacterized protein n=1 Tax=Triangularia verruculosa TaxID=2587418 RepID=A0AAN7AUQ3_9PEZI|nr:hypothetical protein QBC40DRAFT_277319 [Triangularia verruculosa]
MVGIVMLMEEFEVGNGRDEERWERYFGRGLGMEYMKRRGFVMVENGCMACVLGVVGGRMGMVTGLRASCLGRARRRTPRLLGRWLLGWVEGFSIVQQREAQAKSEEMARAIRTVRGFQRERFTVGRRGEWVSPRLMMPRASDHSREHGGQEYGEQQHQDEANGQHGSNNPYHRSAGSSCPSQPEPPQPGPIGGFDGHFDDDEIYHRLMDDIIPDRHHIHSPMPIPPPSSHEDDKREGYVPPRQSWTAYPSPLFSSHRLRNQPPDRPSNRVTPGHSHSNPPHPYQATGPITPPQSTSESCYYADEIYDQYHHTGRKQQKPRTKVASTPISPSRPRPEEYDGLVGTAIDKKEVSLSDAAQHRRRLNDNYSEKTMRSRLKRRLEGSSNSSPRSKISSSGRTQWVDFI